MKSFVLSMSFLVFAFVCAGAQSVGLFLYFEGGDTTSDNGRSIDRFLSASMGDLFDMGFIATNETPKSGNESDYLSFAPDDEQREAGLDYTIAILVKFAENNILAKSLYKLMDVKSGELIKEGFVDVNNPGSKERTQLDRAFFIAGSAVISDLKPHIRSFY